MNSFATATSHPTRTQRIQWTLLGLTVALVWLTFVILTRHTVEDAYITFRYARNLALGHGFVFNLGERVLGTTTPLYTLILALAATLVGPEHLAGAAKLFGAVSMAFTCAFSHLMLRRLELPRFTAFVTVGVLALHPALIWNALSGMETPLVLLTMSGSGYALMTRRWLALGVASGALVLLRPDGLVWVTCLAVFIVRERAAAWGKSLLGFCLPVVPWVLFATTYFGSPIPASIAAKQTIGPSVDLPLLSQAATHAFWLLRMLRLRPPALPEAAFYLPFFILATVGGATILIRRSRGRALCLALFPILMMAAYVMGGAPTSFKWYAAPIIWALALLTGFGLHEVAGRARSWHRGRLATQVAAGVVLLGLATAIYEIIADARVHQRNHERLLKHVGVQLAEVGHPGATVALEGIGYVGYFSQLRVIDLAGLVTPRLVDWRRQGLSHAEVFNDVLRVYQPDFVVLRSFEVPENRHFHGGPLFDVPEHEILFHRQYHGLETVRAPLPATWGSLGELTIYARRQQNQPDAGQLSKRPTADSRTTEGRRGRIR